MNIDFNEIPSQIFDWIQTKPFSVLNPKEKHLVNKYFDELEYNEMHFSAKNIKSKLNRKSDIKANLIMKLPRKQNFELYYSFFWKAACFCLLGSTLYFGLKNEKEIVMQNIAKVDTVFVDKFIEIPIENHLLVAQKNEKIIHLKQKNGENNIEKFVPENTEIAQIPILEFTEENLKSVIQSSNSVADVEDDFHFVK